LTPVHTLSIRVYWEDTDASGLVYHAAHIRFMERGRTELLRTLGLVQRDLLESPTAPPIFFVVRKMDVDFERPGRMDDLLTVETAVAAIGGASVDLDQRVLRDSELLAKARVRVVCVEGGRARRLPAQARESFLKAL
jgi:acyl-CoA thioester hydrolase